MTDKQIMTVVTGFRKGILARRSSVKMCWMVCWPLQTYLNGLGIQCTLSEGEVELTDHNAGIKINHFWLTLADGRIIDPTADQFNFNMKGREDMPKVYFGEKPKWYLPKQKRKIKKQK